ncbi:CGNR zinc finger domain-containing protein [Pseudomonas sp. SWRI18]|uniref:CGNR zinc finger domain-containing protein n=1 Tax=Pseudomonas sp. SWRI18 TaxID=2753888 RepID=UPI00164704EF|nr:CGNR zinc finger domain-containing protein [Pseudomonas sp. SWRI18]MBC3304121.1 CGNR zinc finger domain-containing protein [Pseudomonas sp. SWRI18]
MTHFTGTAKSIRLIGGARVLDFINTTNGRRPGTALKVVEERLTSFRFFFEWARHASLVSAQEFDDYKPMVFESSMAYQPDLDRIIAFRECLYRVFYPLSSGGVAPDESLQQINQVFVQGVERRVLRSVEGKPAWGWKPCTTAQELTAMVLGRLAIEATQLLVSGDLHALRSCGATDCDWVFLDISKNKQRKWCQMSVCGSREKLSRLKQVGGAQ